MVAEPATPEPTPGAARSVVDTGPAVETRVGTPAGAGVQPLAPRSEPESSKDRRLLIGSALTVLMALMFATVTILGESLLNGTQNGYLILTVRFAGATVLLAVFIAATGRPLLPARGEWLAVALAGTIGYGTEAAFYYGALNRGDAGTVVLLFYTYPAIVMAATIALERKAPPRLLFLALGCAIAGSAIVILGGAGVSIEPIGVVLILCCATGYAGYLIALDRAIPRTDLMTSTMWLAAGAALANGIFSVTFGNNVVPHGAEWWRVIGMAVFTAGAFVCLLASLRLVGALRNAIIGVTEPLAVALLGALFLSERITASTAIGGSLILAGAIAAVLGRAKSAS